MKKLALLLPAVAIMALVTVAAAGVIVDEQQTVGQANGKQVTRMRTVMIEGDKQKSIIDNGDRTVITDLGKGTMMMVDGKHKTYVELPFPPKGKGAAAMQGAGSPTISFKKTGGHDKLIGYSCDEYTGAGMVGANSVSMSGCFSDTAPGATDYSNFQREMADKVKGTTMANMGQIPQGVPLRLKITTTMGNVPATGMSPEMAAKLNQMLAHRQFVTDTTVSKITTKSLPGDLFQAPAGYQKREQLSRSGGAPPPPPAPHKVPE
jgi:hypothetical protein